MEEMKEMVKVVDNTKPYQKPAELKEYLLCLVDKNSGEKSWNIVVGRTEAYESIKNDIEWINLEESFILVESLVLEKRKSIYAFMKYVEQFYEDNFDIEDYVKGDWSEDDFEKNNSQIDDKFNIDNSKKVDQVSILNGEIGYSDLN